MTEETPPQEEPEIATDEAPAEEKPGKPEPSLTERIEQEQKERRLRAEMIDVGQNWYGGSDYRADNGGTVYGAGRDLLIQLGGEDADVRSWPVPTEDFDTIRACLVTTLSQRELLERLAAGPVVLLRGDPHTGRWTAALHALMEHGLTCNLLSVKDPKKIRPENLRPGNGYVLRADDGTWPRHPEAMLERLRAVASESAATIIVVVTNDCAITKSVVTHEPPTATEVFRKWLVHHVEGIEQDLAAEDERLSEHIAGCRPWEAVRIAEQIVGGLRQGRTLADMITELPYAALAQLSENLKNDQTGLGRHFLVSSAVLHGLPEAIVSDAALALAVRVRQDEQRDEDDGEDRGIPVWERLHEWTGYPGLSTAEAARGGEGQRVEIRPSMAARLLALVWEQQPAIRPALYDWLAELVEADDWRVQLKAAYAVGRLATCDFQVIDKRFFTPWSKEEDRTKVLTWALEAAAVNDPDVAVLVRDKLKVWTTGTYLQRLSAALAYGSTIGIRNIKDALGAFRTIAHTATYLEPCDAVARSVAEVYTSATAKTVLRELARWARGEVGERLTAALAFVRLASALQEHESYPPLHEHEPVSELALLWTNALNWGLSQKFGTSWLPAYTPSSWSLIAEWAERAATKPEVNAVVEEMLGRPMNRLRPSWTFHLYLWHKRGTITGNQFSRYIRLMREG
ncbi:hypothetical protein ACQP2T_03390 [Nonomuraea sp. CA-143628]|uniref:hypothetical protein n=1 Tax=Nonomuraea sp. CA-143628 TaxID=3239997 RepID=UPI003D8AF268